MTNCKIVNQNPFIPFSAFFSIFLLEKNKMKKVHEFQLKSKIVLLAYLNYYQYYLNYTIITTDTKNFLKMGGGGGSPSNGQPFKFLIKKNWK